MGTDRLDEPDEAAWRRRLTPEQFHVLRRAGTERPFSGVYVDEKAPGTYRCAGCHTPLFAALTKYDSGTGWPSFWEAIDDAAVQVLPETDSTGRTEVRCASCDGHLGHVFDDGPHPTGLRYCINSVALDLETDEP